MWFNRKSRLQRLNKFFLFFSAYEQVRQKYHSEGAFPHLYEKIKPEINVLEVGKAFMDPL